MDRGVAKIKKVNFSPGNESCIDYWNDDIEEWLDESDAKESMERELYEGLKEAKNRLQVNTFVQDENHRINLFLFLSDIIKKYEDSQR